MPAGVAGPDGLSRRIARARSLAGMALRFRSRPPWSPAPPAASARRWSELLGEAGIPQVVVARRVDRLEELAATLRRQSRCSRPTSRTADGSAPSSIASLDATAADRSGRQQRRVRHVGDVPRTRPRAARRRDRAQRRGADTTDQPRRARRDGAARSRLPAQRQQRRQLPAGAELAVYAATKAYVTCSREPARRGARHAACTSRRCAPGLTRTEFQSVSNTELVHRATIPSMAWMTRRPTSPQPGCRRCRQGRGALGARRALQDDGAQLTSMTPRGLRRDGSAQRRPRADASDQA